MRSEPLATLILPFEELDFITQINNDITESQPSYIIAAGRKHEQQEQTMIVQKIEYTHDHGEISISQINEIELLLKEAGLHSKVTFASYSQQAGKLIVQTNDHQVTVLDVTQ